MIKIMKWMAGGLLAAALAACGGGGGSAGTTTGTTGSNAAAATPTLTLSLIDASGMPTSTISNTGTVFAKAVAKDGAGAPVSGSVVTFSSGTTASLRFVPTSGTALTGQDGTAQLQVLPASSTSSGAGTLTASATVGTAAVTATANYQIPVGASDPATAKVADFVMLLDKSSLANAGTATAKLTVLAVDASNNIVPGATVSVSTNANTVFTPTGTVTDTNGTYTGSISFGADKTDRTVTITTTINGITKQTTLAIAGSSIALTSNPAILTPSTTATLTARLTDAASVPIANTTLAFSGDVSSLTGQTAKTDANGNVSLTFTAPATAGAYIVTAAGSGVTSSLSLQVGAGAVIPVATIPTGVLPSLSALPNIVAPNAVGSTASQSQLRFLMIDGTNKPVSNVRVRFSITSTGLGSFDSSISSGTSTVYTNSSGVATATFIPGTTSSPTDGVIVKACYSAIDFTSASACPASVTVRLTVASQGLAISIGNDNKIASANGIYTKKFVVTVADAAGRPVQGAQVDISVDLPYYGKGSFDGGITFPLLVQPIDQNQDIPSDPSIVPGANRVTCINQDLNRNGFVDPTDPVTNFDGFGQPVLLPRKSDLLISYVDPAVKQTDANGVLNIQVQYSQRFATWLEYHLRASTTVAGSQGTAERAFITTYDVADASNGSFLLPPYGVGACNSPN